MSHAATYSPEDDKIRIYLSYRLSAEDYAPVKAAGFHSAPKQGCVFAVWSPKAEDLAIELCGEIEDEDKSLVERAEDRAERFEEYSDNRKADYESAHRAVSAIADNIPLGQPILVGHHSERHARRDAEKIENGMRKAVKMWDTAQYWKDRAAGALAHAKYKERPDVRARRIKTLEAELNRCIAAYTPVTTKDRPKPQIIMQQRWGELYPADGSAGNKDAAAVPHVFCGPKGSRGGSWVPVEDLPKIKEAHKRWEDHLMNRLEYEHAMLEEQGATKLLDKKPKSWQATLPLCNYRAPGGVEIENNYHPGSMMHYAQVEMVQAEYAKIYADYKGTRVVGNSHRVRTAVIKHAHVCVFLTDSKIHVPPPPTAKPERQPRPSVVRVVESVPTTIVDENKQEVEALRTALKQGVQVVSANQLFPTPPALARRMAELADIEPAMHVLEPSAGTGNIWRELSGKRVAIEINPKLAEVLKGMTCLHDWVHCRDFLAYDPKLILDRFDRVVMNPPFENGADIKHILHALEFLKPGGRLVAICANGPRQNEKLRPMADSWEELPEGTFEGTGVRTVMLVINKKGDWGTEITYHSIDKAAAGGDKTIVTEHDEDGKITDEFEYSDSGICGECGRRGVLLPSGNCKWCATPGEIERYNAAESSAEHETEGRSSEAPTKEDATHDGGSASVRETADTPQPLRPTLGETAAEAQRMTYAGRSSVALRESKVYDVGRLNEMPLFKSQGELF